MTRLNALRSLGVFGVIGAVGGTIFTVIILAVIVVAMAVTADWPYEARLLPRVIGVPAALLCVALLVMDVARLVRGGPQKARAQIMDMQADTDMPLPEVAQRAAAMFAWVLGLFAAVVLVGFLISIPVFIFLYLMIQGRETLRTSIIAGIAMLVFTVVTFHYLLRVSWLPGVFPLPQEHVIEWLNALRPLLRMGG
ncbi:MAG: tripartite tricarboxylate transporter TctB family protein [Pseudolabrys sp.]|nr:tripartite tricarboxylate transporter TctB family protein [Pseudolabrys sp.]